jgi:hypothetical protein
VAAFSLRSIEAREGAVLADAMASEPVALRKDGGALTASFELDPAKVRRSRAESDVVIGQITGQAVTLDQALTRREKEKVSGSIVVRLDLASDGMVVRRTRRLTIETKDEAGTVTTEKREEVTEARSSNRLQAGLGQGPGSL